MRYGFSGVSGLMVCLALAGCGDQEPQTPLEPQFGHGTFPACDFNFNSLISQFFDQPQQGTVLTLKQEMEAAHTSTTPSLQTVKDKGFEILANIEAAVNLGEATDFEVGASLANRVLTCMIPSPPTVLSDALGALGAFGVRSEGSSPVLAHDGFSGVKPSADSLWSTVLSSRTLMFGQRAEGALSYDWFKAPADSFNNPGVSVALCVSSNNTTMVQETSSLNQTFVLAYDGAYSVTFLTCPNVQDVTFRARSSSVEGWGPLAITRRLLHALAPDPLEAATAFTHPLSGSGKLFSHFEPTQANNAASEYLAPPAQTVQVGVAFPEIRVEVTVDGEKAVNQLVTLQVTPQISNKGANVAVSGDKEFTNSDGVARFLQFKILKAGTYTVQAFFELNRPGVEVSYDIVGGIQAGGTGKKK